MWKTKEKYSDLTSRDLKIKFQKNLQGLWCNFSEKQTSRTTDRVQITALPCEL